MEDTYTSFIAERKAHVLEEGTLTHRHHIVPKSKGGTDDSSNIVFLTPQEHGYAHYLYDIENGTETSGFFLRELHLSFGGKHSFADFEPLNVIYEKRALAHSDRMKGRYKGESNPFYGKTHSEESRQKISESMKGENHPNFGKHRTDETRKKLSESAKRYWASRRLQPCL